MPTPTTPNWQPIESAPRDCVTVLTIHRDDLFPVAAFCVVDFQGTETWLREVEGPEDTYDRREGARHKELYRTPTHWMPLPDPLKGHGDTHPDA